MIFKKKQDARKAEKILMSEVPVIPLFTYTSINLKQKYISGFYANKLDQHALKYVKILIKRKEMFPLFKFYVERGILVKA